jgi:hypothetical protein
MKRTLTMTYLLGGICMFSPSSILHAQDRQEDQAGAHGKRDRNGELRALRNFLSQGLTNAASDSKQSKIQKGFDAAPVPLNLDGKDMGLVGLGSYIVNIESGCNGCHSNGPATQYSPGGNPYFGQPKMTNAAVYLGGGRDFGPLIPGTGSIVSRNLTPDNTGLPVGGHTFDEFVKIIRTGVDMDHLHPQCMGAPDGKCLLPPFVGDLLQIMPWPEFQDMTDHDLRAIYEYLKAVPCIAGPPAPSVLHNDCS